MSILLLPVSLFIKQLNDLPVSYLRELPIYIFVFLIIFSIILRKKANIKGLVCSKVFICLILVIFFQLLAMLLSYADIGNDTLNRNPIKEFVKFLIFLGCILVHYVTVKMIVNNINNIQLFIKGNGIALIISLCIVYVQFLYLLFPTVFDDIVSIIGNFEKRFDRTWYDNGSYVQTMGRINGINQESSYLAAQLLVIFVPFILSSIKNKTNIFSINSKYNPVIFYLLLISIIIILFFAKTSTGILAIFLIVFSLWISLPMKRKIKTGFLLVIAGFVGYFIVINSSVVMNILNEYLFDKAESGSSMNRIGGTIALIIVWLKNFIVGIGWNYHDYYLFKNVPIWTTFNYEFQNVYKAENFYPILSVFFGWLAEFGTICVLFILIYIYKLLRDFRSLSKKAKFYKNNSVNIKILDLIKDSAHYFVFFYIICSLFVFDWSESIYLVMFFFFVVVRRYYKNVLSE
ncbi:hypothetical protein [Aeribacillus sp. FSL k6-2211]|uniref:hypothetical protein n=1 Tax=Aeribacillus sp. FSL k6-2211 TaxID=2954608 RepID=UPI0030D0130E